MSNDIRRLSEELARDPHSLAFLPLADALRRAGQLDVAMRVALGGLERHPYNADAHDLLARIYADRDDATRAFDEWDAALRLVPGHVGACKGIGYLLVKQNRLREAETYLAYAAEEGGDAAAKTALENVRRELSALGTRDSALETPRVDAHDASTDEPAPTAESRVPSAESPVPLSSAFSDCLGDPSLAAMLVDGEGLVIAGGYPREDGSDRAEQVGAALSGVSEEAQRAMRHLGLGAWTSISFEADAATVAMAPGPDGALLVVAADRALPLGFLRRAVDRCVERARKIMAEVA